MIITGSIVVIVIQYFPQIVTQKRFLVSLVFEMLASGAVFLAKNIC